MKLVAAGDFHVPHRADSIPESFYKALESIKPEYLVLTGDYTKKYVLDEVSSKAEELGIKVLAVRGNMDDFELPKEEVLDLSGGRTLGVIHGHQIYPRGNKEKLYRYAKNRNWKILLHGHLHTFSVDPYFDILMVNPGTLTGARGGISLGPNPKTFAVIDANPGKKLVIIERREASEEEYELVGTRRIKL